MNEKIKTYLTLAGNTINKLPFKKLSEKYSDKVPVLKSIAPFANFIVCGLVVVLIIAKIIVPQVKFNRYMAKIEKPWKEEIQSYETLDFSEEFKTTFDKISSEINACTNDRAGLKKFVEVKENSEKQLDEMRKTCEAKLDEISNKTSDAFGNIENPTFVMSTSQVNKYRSLMTALSAKSQEAWLNTFSKNNAVYDEYMEELNKVCSEKIEKINEAIKEADRKAYIAFVQKSIVGFWVDNHNEGKIEFNSNGTFSFKYHRNGFKPKRPPKAMYNMTDGSTLINLINEDEFTTPERLRNFSGKYSFQDDVLILDVKSAEYKNMPEVNSGDKLKMKISFADNGDRLWFDKKTYKRK